MDALVDEDDFSESLSGCIGAAITAISEDDEAVRLHLSDGSMLSVYALEDGGFAVAHEHEAKH